MSESRIQQLIDAGVATNAKDFSADSTNLINSISDDEFNCLLSIRSKISEKGGLAAGEYDKFLCIVI